MKFQYVFNCPVHGWEQEVVCWRAYQKENDERWKKISLIEVPFESGEKEKFLEELHESQ